MRNPGPLHSEIDVSQIQVESKMAAITRNWRMLANNGRGLSTVAGGPPDGDTKLVKIPESGEVKGSSSLSAWSQRKFYQFLGIRYAEPPTGKLRFKAPMPVKPWQGVLDATKHGRPSVMLKNIRKIPDAELDDTYEDCLNLCVYTKDTKGKKPVMVYIHGGAFWDGCAAEYPPDYILEKDVVLVVPQYRLGPLGFLSTLTEEIPGNAALQDVVLALEWVKKNISHFGGDPDQITAVGQSAGAGLLSCLLYSPNVSEDLFHKMILQSGSPFSTWIYNLTPEKCAREIVAHAGFDHKLPLDKLNQCLMDMNIKSLYKGFFNHVMTGTGRGIDTIGGLRMTIGGPSNMLPDTPHNLWKKGKGRKNLPLLIGCTKHDGSFAMADMYDVLQATIGVDNKRFNAYSMIEHMTRIYAVHDYTGLCDGLIAKQFFTQAEIESGDFMEMLEGVKDLTNTIMIKSAVLKMAKINAFNKNDTYLYSFDYRGEYTRFRYGRETAKYPFDGGVHHSDDNIYLYPFPHPELNKEDAKMSRRMVDLWTSFVIEGVPKADDVREWPKMSRYNGPYLKIDQEPKIAQDYIEEFTVNSAEKHAKKK